MSNPLTDLPTTREGFRITTERTNEFIHGMGFMSTICGVTATLASIHCIAILINDLDVHPAITILTVVNIGLTGFCLTMRSVGKRYLRRLESAQETLFNQVHK